MSKVVDTVVNVVDTVFDYTGLGALWDSLAPDLPENDLATLGQGLQKGIDQPRRITFGRDRVGGIIAHQAEVEKGDKKWMQLIVLINGAPIDALEEIYIADKKLSDYPSESWDYELSDGRQTTANAKAVAKMAGWTSEHVGFGQSYIFIEIENNREVFEDGIGDMGFLIRGARVWDPRDTSQDPDDETTWLWSQNAVLCALHYVRFYGAYEVPFSRLPLQWWIAAINVCDEDAEFTDAQGVVTTEPRYTTNGSFTFSTKPIDVLNQLEACFAGKIFRQMGQWYVRVGAWYGNPTYTINQDDVHGNIKIKWHADLRDRANVVRATFTDPEQNYDRTDAPPVVSTGYQTIDNQILEKSISLPFVRSSTTAQRLATIYLEQTRLGEIELPLKHKGLAAAVGRTVLLNLPRESINNKIYRVTERRFRLDGGVSLMCVEDGPNLWADNIIPGAQDLTPNSDYLVGKPQPVFDVRVTIDGDGNGIIKWNHPTPLAVNEYDVEFINTDANEPVFKTSVTYTQVTIPNLQLGEYTARISAKNIFGQRSQLVAVQFNVLTPTLPTVYVTADYNQITLTAEIAAAGIGTAFEWEFLGTNAQPQSGERVLAQIYNRIGLKSETDYKFRVRSVNHLGESDWVNVTATTTTVDLTEYINELPLTKLSEEAQTLIADINAQVDRLRPETENNLPSLIAKNLDAITGLAEKVQVIDAENPNNLQQQLANSNSKIDDLERVTEVLDESNQNSLPALIKINNIAIEQQRLAQQNIGLSLLNITSAYTNWRNEYERRAFNNERLIDAAVYVDPDTGTIVNRAFAYADESFNSATLLIDGVNSKITLASQQIAQSQNRISHAEAQLIVQAAQINQKATFSEVESQIAGALAALQPAYSWQFNTSSEGFDPDSHNALGYIVATAQISSPAISYNADENPMFRLRVRKHSGGTWKGDIKFNGGATALHLPEPTSSDFETLTLDATGTQGYTGTITSLEFDLGACDIDFIEVGKRGANDLALADITARTTELEQDINAATGVMAQYATTAWVNALGYQTQSNVQTLIDSFNTQYSIAATLQEFNDQDIIVKANAAQTWIDGANATIRDQVTSILNSDDGVNQRISTAEQSIDAIAGEISQSITQVSGLEIDVKGLGLNEVIAAYNKMQQDKELAEQSFSLAAANQKLAAVTNDVESLATQTLELVGLYGQNAAYLTSLNQAFANERTARSSTERELRAEIINEGTRSVAQANERVDAIVGYCVDAEGNKVDEVNAMACIAAGHEWVDGPLVQLINDYTSVFVNNQGYQTAANVEQFISTFDGEYSITATIQQINDEGIITAAKEAQQWINAADGTITNLITQFVNKPNGINDNIAFAYDLIQANADDLTVTANSQQQLSVRMGSAEADLNRIDNLVSTEQQARASMGSQLRIEFQTQDLAMLATANEFTRAVTGYCVDAEGNRVDEPDAMACIAAGHEWIDGPAVQRAVEIGAAWVTLQGYQTQSNVSQLLDTFNATYQISATLQQFADNGTLQKANNAQQFINAAEGYIENQITLFNDKEDGVNATFANVKQRLDAAEGAVTTSIVQIQGLELGQQAQGLNDVIAAYNQMMQDNELATLNVKASLANEKLQAQAGDFESLAQQQLELAAIFNNSNAIITSLNKAVANQYQSSVVRDQRYQATFENVTARFSDVTTALATINEASTLRDEEFASFVDDTIAEFDEITQTFASQDQAFSTLQQTLTSKINDDTEAAKNTAIATAQQYTRTAVGYCVNAEGQITSENDAVQCVADGGSWVNGPLAEFIANMQITDGESTASIKQLRQLFTTVGGKLVARGGWTLDNNGRVTGIAGYNDGEIASIDLVGDVIRQGVMVGDTFVPTSYVDNTDPQNPQHVIRGRLVLGDGHQVNTLDDIKAQDGADGVDGASAFTINAVNANAVKTGNSVTKVAGSLGWDAGAQSVMKYKACAVSATLNDSRHTIFGLSQTANTLGGYEHINYALYGDQGSISIYESGTYVGFFGSYTSSDNLAVECDGEHVHYYKNGVLFYSSLTAPTGEYGFDCSIYQVGTELTNIAFTQLGLAGYSPIKGIDYFDGNDGTNGTNGTNGSRGSIEVSVATSIGAWSDATANASVPGSPVEHDRVTIYKSSDAKIQTTKRYNGSSWESYTLRIHGSALIDDTLDGKVLRAGTRIESPRIDLIGGAFMKIELASGFGPDSLWYWYGPKIMSNGLPNLAALRKSNALEWKDTSGNAYFGGSITTGILSTALTTTSLASNANVTIGPFGSNGGVIDLVCSLQANAYATGRSDTAPSAPPAPDYTIVLYEYINGGWVSRKTQSFTGSASVSSEYDFESRKYLWSTNQS
ncbi:fibronectin type III domain-containing protein [Pseudoalteromonas rhizosphaerae]|uniref:fibronectin type III domain-containing protein n=1 Tax=Pseudoalteromonas rhizosphaerae TaxID=2518973 RepID=UPI001230D719|nr:fibronectin type III domain-containing protein [Pseudoalteromonas rhizosphaerae]